MAKKSINIRAGYDLAFFSKESQNLAREMRKSGKKMQSIGKSLSMSLTAPITILGGLAVKTFATFEQSMAKVQAISGATGKEFENLTNLAKQLGITTRFSASEVSDLMLNYSKLGFSSEEIEKITGATLDLALATGEDLAQSASLAGGTLRGFGLEADQMVRVTNVMARAFSGSALDLQKFQNAMPKVSAVASSLGFTLEETTAMLGVLVNKNIQATTAGTGLKNIFLKSKKEGISFANAMNKIKNAAEPSVVAMNMFGAENAQVAVALAESGEAIAEMNAKLNDTSITASSMAAIMDNTLEGAMKRLNSATEGLAIEFGEIMAPAIGKVADLLASFALMVSKLPKPVKTVITVVAGLTAVIGPLIFAIGGLKIAFATITKSTLIITAKIVALIAVIAGIALVYQYIRDNSEAFKDFFYNLWVRIANNTIEAVKTIAKGLAKFAGLFGIDIGVDAFFDQFKLKPREATKELKSFGDTISKVKEKVASFTLQDVEEEETGKRKTPEKLLSPKEATKKVSTLKAEINDIMKGFQPEVIPFVNVEKMTEQLKKKTETAKHKFVEIGEQMGEALANGLERLVSNSAVMLGEFIGDAMTGDADAKDFGKSLLNAVGGFLQQMGAAMIGFGISFEAFKKSIETLNPALAIAGGIALVAAGAAISNLSKKGIEGTGGSSPMATPMGGGMGTMNTQPIALETKISGRDLILVQNREKGFTR
jgi:hypothetical protein